MTKNLNLSEEQVKHVAKLAAINLTPAEVKKFQKQLSSILDYVNLLKEADTGKVKLTSQVTGLMNIFKKDNQGPSLTQKQSISGAKNVHEGMFKIKAIFE